MHFQFDYLCNVTTHDMIFCCCRPVNRETLILQNSLMHTILKP